MYIINELYLIYGSHTLLKNWNVRVTSVNKRNQLDMWI